MATTPIRFVTATQVANDLLATLQADTGTDPDLDMVHANLDRPSNCDFKAEMLAGVALDGGATLAQAIRTFVRNNSGDTTALKSAQRLYLNPQAGAIKRSHHGYSRTTQQLTQPFNIAYERPVVRDLATLEPCYTRVGNVLTFTRAAKIMVVTHLNWGIWNGVGEWDSVPVAPSWRFASGGNNRVLSGGLNLLIEGSLSQGMLARKLQPQATVFYEEEIYPSSLRQLCSTMVLDVLTPTSNQGRIERLSLVLERSPYILSYGTLVDNLGFFKNTVAGVEDTSNFFEIIEL